jgi:predicted phage terminase large subunit-like protein
MNLDLIKHLQDIQVFHNFVLPILNPELNVTEDFSDKWSVPDFHWELYKNLQKAERLQLIVAPVGFAKSTILKIFALHEVLVGKQDQYIVYISSTDTKAVEHLGAMSKVLKTDYVKAVFGYEILSSNTHELIIFYNKKKYKIEAVASGADIAGKNFEGIRPSLIIPDDLEDLEQANSLERTDKLEDWFFTILLSRLPSLTTGRIRMINTVLSLASLTNRILGKAPNIDPLKLNQFKDFSCYFYQALDGDDQSIWEARHPTILLHKERELRPGIFARNYMNAPFDAGETLIKNENIQYYNSIELSDFPQLFLHADITHTAKTKSDYFCVCVIGKSKLDNKYYVIDFDLRKDLKPKEQADNIISFYHKYPNIKIGTYDAQSNDWFEEHAVTMARNSGIYINFYGVKFPKDKIHHLNMHIDKFMSKSIILPKKHPLISLAVNQLTTFPMGAHDDFVDGINGALDLATAGVQAPTFTMM